MEGSHKKQQKVKTVLVIANSTVIQNLKVESPGFANSSWLMVLGKSAEQPAQRCAQ